MTIQRNPHPLFAAYWLLWYGAVIAAVLMPDRPLFGLLVLLAFLPAEGLAVARKGAARDTLSEIFTWAQRKLSPTRDFARGWNAMLLTLVLLVTWLLGRTLYHYSGALVLAVVIAGLATVWLYDHWWHPDVRG